MTRSILCAVASFLLLASCQKSSSNNSCAYTPSGKTASAAEITSLQNYLSSHSITTAVQHSSGFFYEITAPGTGASPVLCSGIVVKYIGSLESGTIFDSNTSGASFTLGQLIDGWQQGLPLIKAGGSIKLYIPPSLGYGSSSAGSIPANSNLIFNIQLVSVQ